MRGSLPCASCLPESFRRALVADAREDSPVSDAPPALKRDEHRTRHASPPTKCNTPLRPARVGAGAELPVDALHTRKLQWAGGGLLDSWHSVLVRGWSTR